MCMRTKVTVVSLSVCSPSTACVRHLCNKMNLPANFVPNSKDFQLWDFAKKFSLMSCLIVISRAWGMYGICCTKARGCIHPRVEGNTYKCHASRMCVIQLVYIYPVGIATMDVHRTLKKKEKTSSSYLKRTHKAAFWIKLSNVDRTSECLVTEGCG